MNLFGYYRSSASYRIRIVLNLKGIDWAYRTVRLTLDEQQHPDFLARNPSGLVPVLEHGGTVISQSAAIAEYLEERWREPPLLPAEPEARAQVREMMAVIGCDVHPLQNLRVLRYLREQFSADGKAVKAWIRHWIGAGFSAFEALARRAGSDGRHACGRSVTLADAWLVPQVYNARRYGVELADYPLIAAIEAHCLTQQAFADAIPERQPDAPD